MTLTTRNQASQNATPLNAKNQQRVAPSPGKENAAPTRVKKYNATPAHVEKYKGSIIDAVKTEHVEEVRKAITDGVDLYKTYQGSTALIIASEIGNQNIVNLLIRHASGMLNEANTHGTTPLIAAAKNGHKDVVALLIKAEADPNLQDNNGMTPLMTAAKNAHTEIVDQLMLAGADPNLQDNNCKSAIAFASEVGSLPLVNQLMIAGDEDDLNTNTTYGIALIAAAEKGHLTVVDLLIQNDAELNLPYAQGYTALGVAAEMGHLDVVSRLIEVEAIKCQTNDHYNTSLMIAIRDRNSNMALKLIEAGANINANAGSTALIYAAQSTNFSVARKLIEAGAYPDLKDKNGNTALIYAADRGYKKNIVDLLIKAGANLNERGNNSFTPLMLAAQEGCCKDIVDLLVKAGADLEMKDINGRTALMFAGIKGHINLVKLLLIRGADSSTLDLEQLGNRANCNEKCTKLVELARVADDILDSNPALTYDGIIDIDFVLSRIHAKSPSRYEEIMELECSKLINFADDDSNIIALPPIRLLINNIVEARFASEISASVRSLFEWYVEQSDRWDKYVLSEYIDCLLKPQEPDTDNPRLTEQQLEDLFKIISQINIKILQEYADSSPDAQASLLSSMANIGLEPEETGAADNTGLEESDSTKRGAEDLESPLDQPNKKTRDEAEENEVDEALLGGDISSGINSLVQLTGESSSVMDESSAVVDE